MKYYLIFIFLSVTLFSVSQEIKNISLVNDTISVLYIGIENQVWVEGVDTTKDIQLKSNFFVIEKTGKKTFSVKAQKDTIDNIEILVNNQSIYSKKYSTKRIERDAFYPSFASHLFYINTTNFSLKADIALAEIRQNPTFRYQQNTLLKKHYEIVSFDFLLYKYYEDVVYKTFGTSGTSLFFRDTLSRAAVNDVLIFENIKVKNIKTGEIKKVPAQTYTIIE